MSKIEKILSLNLTYTLRDSRYTTRSKKPKKTKNKDSRMALRDL